MVRRPIQLMKLNKKKLKEKFHKAARKRKKQLLRRELVPYYFLRRLIHLFQETGSPVPLRAAGIRRPNDFDAFKNRVNEVLRKKCPPKLNDPNPLTAAFMN